MSDYTPTTNQVRGCWMIATSLGPGIEDQRMALVEFDSWLRSVQRAAWDEGASGFRRAWHGEEPNPENPYREVD